MKVGIDALACIPVELGNGGPHRLRPFGVQGHTAGVRSQALQSGGQLDLEALEVVGLDHVVALPIVEGHRPAEHRAIGDVDGALIEDHEHQVIRVLAAMRIPLEVRLAPLVVGGLLVEGTAPVPIDHEHRVPERGVDVAAGCPVEHGELDHHLVPPGMGHVAETGPDLGPEPDEVPRCRRCRRAAHHRTAQVIEGEALVVQEPPGGEDHTAAGPDESCAHPGPDLEPDDLASVVAQQVCRFMIRADLGTPARSELQQPVHERRSPGWVPSRDVVVAEHRLNRSPDRTALLREMGVVAGVVDGLERSCAPFGQPINGRCPVVVEHLEEAVPVRRNPQGGVGGVVHDRVAGPGHVLESVSPLIDQSRSSQEAVVGDPQLAPGGRRRAPHLRSLVEDEDLRAAIRSKRRSSCPCGSCADHDDICDVIPLGAPRTVHGADLPGDRRCARPVP